MADLWSSSELILFLSSLKVVSVQDFVYIPHILNFNSESQIPTQRYGRRPFGVGLLVAGYDVRIRRFKINCAVRVTSLILFTDSVRKTHPNKKRSFILLKQILSNFSFPLFLCFISKTNTSSDFKTMGCFKDWCTLHCISCGFFSVCLFFYRPPSYTAVQALKNWPFLTLTISSDICAQSDKSSDVQTDKFHDPYQKCVWLLV